ncbi:LamG-like jellyroll fold domain-containing protein [Gimesia sp.]|uniref:LamG-like jellyroll fold domain-containing protein n=1 Tax=Gimesia sp. TaxID=2024833 RepID=UPI003A90F3B8
MASHIWIGGAPAIAQIDLTTIPDDVEAGQIVNFTIGNKTLSVTLAGTTLADVVSELVAAWNTSTVPEFEEITAAVGSTAGTFTLTSDTAGKPFAVTVSIGSGNNEKQVITLGGTAATGGTFTLTFDGQATGNIAYNASAGTVETALEALSNIGSGDATVTGDVGGPWTVEFTGALAVTNVALMTINVSNLTGSVNEIQTISSPSNPTGGTFTLTFDGQATAAIDYDANAAAVETALEGLSNIPTGSVSCGGGALPGTPVTVTFQDNLAATDVSLLVADSSGLTGVTGSAAETTSGGSALTRATENYFTFGDASSTTDVQKYGDSVNTGVELDVTTPGWSRVAGGKKGYGVYSNGSPTAIQEPDIGNFAGDDNFSVSCWFKVDTTGTIKLLMSSSSTTTGRWSVGINVDDEVYFLRGPSTVYTFVTTSGTISPNTWHHVVCVCDWAGASLKISLDGAAFDTAVIDDSALSTLTGTSLSLGGSIGGYVFDGFMDSVGLYNAAITIAQAQAIYNSGSGDDYPFPGSSVNEEQTLTLTGSPSAGSVTVSYQGVGVDIPYDATAAEAEALLESVSTIGAGNVNVTGGDWPGTALVVEFIGDLALTDVELLDVDTSNMVMTVAETTKGVTAPTGTVTTTVTPLTQSTTTACEGPNHWAVAANWNTNTVPETGDTVYISDSNTDILYGLDQSAITLAALYIEQTFTGAIGLPRVNTDGDTSYFEYRDQYLKIGATLLNIGDKQGDGSERIKINLGSVQTTALITNSGDSPDGNTPAILLLGTHASNTININRGSLGIAYYPTEVATVTTLRQAFFDNALDDTTVYLGAGVTVADIVKSGGVLDINSNTTSFRQTAGTTTIHAGAHTVLNVLAGLLNYNSTGTLAAVNLSGDGVLVFDQDARPKDVTVIDKFTDESEIFDESGSIASPVIDLNNCGDLSTIHIGQDFKLTFGATT